MPTNGSLHMNLVPFFKCGLLLLLDLGRILLAGFTTVDGTSVGGGSTG